LTASPQKKGEYERRESFHDEGEEVRKRFIQDAKKACKEFTCGQIRAKTMHTKKGRFLIEVV
jgi:hypothetical protein